jgi:hypothetical protein
VLPLVVIDPGQRFTENADTSEKRAIDALFGAVVAVLCNEVGAAVIATSDTTKDAAKNIPIDVFLGEDATALAARVLAGSYAITHDASCCILLQAERPADGGLTATQWARVVKSRSTGASSVAYPFTWEQHLGRFRPRDPEPLRKMPAMDGGGDGRQRGGRVSAPATPRASSAPGLSAPPWRGHGREHYQD